MRTWDEYRALLRGERLPLAFVDLAALERNVDRIASAARGTGRTVRVASKSIRHRGLLSRILERGAGVLAGVLAYSVEEAAWLAAGGVDDLLVAYPSTQGWALDLAAEAVAGGARLRLAVDSQDHLEALGAAARRAGVTLEAVIDLDVSLRTLGGRAHLGVRRSPLRSAEAVSALARAARAVPGLRVSGLLAYEAHVAGVPDASRLAPPGKNAAVRALKRLAIPELRALRRDAAEALREHWPEAALVDGGGTGSLASTLADPTVTEVAVGSGFLFSHLFDGYEGAALEPAQFFALEVDRIPDADHVTCAFGGYVASGAPGFDRLPQPVSPVGLRLLGLEGAGEVQTPLDVTSAERRPRVGDPIVFRHAKAGELAERFNEYALVRGDAIEAREPTYRGEGKAFG